MTLTDAWRDVHASRFRDLRLDCGKGSDAGIIYGEDLRDWSDKATTPDQARMERYIDRFDLRNRRILHIGIGNSGLARRLHGRAGEIVGTTIDEPEMAVARSLGVPNYSYVLHNKYSGSLPELGGKFDFILDNNPTSPCCCMRHLATLFEFYSQVLAEGGLIVTDQEGLGWVPETSNPRWSFDFQDLTAVAAAAGFQTYRATRRVYLMSRNQPPSPGGWALARHLFRRGKALPGQVLRNGPVILRQVASRARKALFGSRVEPASRASLGRTPGTNRHRQRR